MHATIRRHESIDQSRKSELVKKVDENLLPAPSELSGFNGYTRHRRRRRRHDLRQLLRQRGAGRRVDPRDRQLAARAEARHGAPHPAEDHERRRIMVVADTAFGGDATVFLAERMITAQLDDAHFAAQLVERLKWAGEDAGHTQREAVIRAPKKSPPR
jgi:hypothetical protein